MIEIRVPISPGELIDKITILEIKSERMSNPDKVSNVRRELQMLLDIWQGSGHADADIGQERAALKSINEQLWVIEDEIREEERNQRFEAQFIRLARAVYVTNDERAAVKRQINEKLGSAIMEEKSYAQYGGRGSDQGVGGRKRRQEKRGAIALANFYRRWIRVAQCQRYEEIALYFLLPPTPCSLPSIFSTCTPRCSRGTSPSRSFRSAGIRADASSTNTFRASGRPVAGLPL